MVGTAGGGAEEAVRRWVEAGGGRLVLDGGLATELEANGADLNDPLWSAKCLLSSPHLIRKASLNSRIPPNPKDPSLLVHMDYLEAGANVIITASYQATIQGFESKGFSKEQSENLLTKSVEFAREAREMFLKEHLDQSTPTQQPILVAASIGSYGAYLADGSEYSGDYGEAGTVQFLKDFHRRRLQVLAEAGPDLIAFETIPNKLEAQAYVELLEECNINIPAWFSFNSKDGVNIESTGVSDGDFVSYVSEWCKDGASLIGGCCRTTPNTIRAIHRTLNQGSNVQQLPVA
nr:unnamed protein product [Digitaria exilis]